MITPEITREGLARPVDAAARWILDRRPALETVVRPFAAVLGRRARVVEALFERLSPLPSTPMGNDDGVVWLGHHPIEPYGGHVTSGVNELIPVLGDAFPHLKEAFEAVARILNQRPHAVGPLCGALLDGSDAAFKALAEKEGLAVGALGFVVHWGVSTLLNAPRRRCEAAHDKVAVTGGHCPFCGSMPAVAFLSRPD